MGWRKFELGLKLMLNSLKPRLLVCCSYYGISFLLNKRASEQASSHLARAANRYHQKCLNRVVQQRLSFKITHIWAKCINIWLGYDPIDPNDLIFVWRWGIWSGIPFWVISQPNVEWFCSTMDHFEALGFTYWKECSNTLEKSILWCLERRKTSTSSPAVRKEA